MSLDFILSCASYTASSAAFEGHFSCIRNESACARLARLCSRTGFLVGLRTVADSHEGIEAEVVGSPLRAVGCRSSSLCRTDQGRVVVFSAAAVPSEVPSEALSDMNISAMQTGLARAGAARNAGYSPEEGEVW
ncbi:hypothetical protein K504DRAFT_188017 [Pleomassaria siparia CBS 279.74]|uniref:Uncharacterized protein n=1 Tax=Pleomassaria siparia CBS 279.74 TaxID=1314801 RepID=A0A6G1JQR0_9PLEO|nr:hypothetical protein K504DRAFT_188017 [Pleomassaria siparia CBS 279.74]